ncbi:MAG: hypothetical protein U1E27_11835, partial [Kiritimatiellia bacterium]|nr:hypothetical protein [Kiritimatiellia bacterium]
SMKINKTQLLQNLVSELKAQLTRLAAAANTSRAEAIDEENQAEDKYDTRGLEASYLAAGQSRQVEETAAAVRQYGGMAAIRFGKADPVDLGALVEARLGPESLWFFIGPCAGGTEVTVGRKTVLVLTPQSPLGQQLLGRKKGDRLKFKRDGIADEYRIESVT